MIDEFSWTRMMWSERESKATNTTQLSSAQHACLELGLHAAFLHQDHSSTLTPISILYVEQFITLKQSTFERLHGRLGMGYASHTYWELALQRAMVQQVGNTGTELGELKRNTILAKWSTHELNRYCPADPWQEPVGQDQDCFDYFQWCCQRVD